MRIFGLDIRLGRNVDAEAAAVAAAHKADIVETVKAVMAETQTQGERTPHAEVLLLSDSRTDRRAKGGSSVEVAGISTRFGVKTIGRNGNVLSRIIFPEPLSDEPWDVQALQSLVINVQKMFARGHFSVCLLDEAIKQFNLTMTHESALALRKLNTIHCVDYALLSPDILDDIPDMMTCIFTEGRAGWRP